VSDTRHIKGLDQLHKALQEVPAKVERNIMRGALRAGATAELLPEVQANLLQHGSVVSGELIAGLKVSTAARRGTVSASIKARGKHGFLAVMLEYGVKAHVIAAKKGGFLSFGGYFTRAVMHPGFAPKAFMRPALDSRGVAAVIAAAEYMKRRLSTKEGLDTADIMIEGDEK